MNGFVVTGRLVRPCGGRRSDRRYIRGLTGWPDGLTRQTLGWIRFRVDCLMYMTYRWFLSVCDTIVCWCELNWCEIVLGYWVYLLFMCICCLRPWEYRQWWIRIRLGRSWGRDGRDAHARKQYMWWWMFSYCKHIVLCAYGKGVKFGLKSKLGRLECGVVWDVVFLVR